MAKRPHLQSTKPAPSEVVVTDLLDGLAESLKATAREMCSDLRRVRVISAGCFQIEPEPIPRAVPAAKPTRSRRPKVKDQESS